MEVRDSLHLFRLSFRNRKKSYCIYSHCLTSEQGKGLGLDRGPSGVACWMHVSSAVVVEVVPSLSHALCLDREGGDYRVPVLKVPKALPSLRAVFCFVFHFAPRCFIIMLLLAALFCLLDEAGCVFARTMYNNTGAWVSGIMLHCERSCRSVCWSEAATEAFHFSVVVCLPIWDATKAARVL